MEFFPKLAHYAQPEVDAAIAERRQLFAQKMSERTGIAAGQLSKVPSNTSPEEVAERIGQQLFRDYGKHWPKIIALASGAAMRAERATLDEEEA